MSQLAPDAGADAQPLTDDGVDKSRHERAAHRARSRLRGSAAPLGVFMLFLAVSCGVMANVWRAPLTLISGAQDALQTSWFFTWTTYALSHHQSPFVSDYMNFPHGINVLWNTSAMAPAIVSWPITAIWNAVLSYNVVMTLSMALAGVFAWLAIRRFVPVALPALAGASVYAFSPYVIAHVDAHLHSVVSAVTAPLLVILLDELLLRQRMRPSVLAVLLMALGVFQFFTHEENFVTELMVALLLVTVLALMFRSRVRERWPYVRRTLRLAVPLTAAVLAYPIYVQLLGPNRVLGAVHDADVYATDLLNLIVPDKLQLIAPNAANSLSNRFTGNASEWNGYLGVPLVAIALSTTVRWWRVPVVRVASVVAGIVALLSLGPHLHIAGHVTPIPLPWWIAAHIPLADDILPARLTVYIYLAVAVLLAFALSRLAAMRSGTALASAAAAFALVPLVPVPIPATPVSAPAFFTTPAVTVIPQGTVVLTVPWSGPNGNETMDPITWAAESHMRFRLIGGYFLGRRSPEQSPLRAFVNSLAGTAPRAPLTDAETESILALLRTNQVGIILLAGVPHEAASRELLSRLLASPGRNIDGADMWLVPQSPSQG